MHRLVPPQGTTILVVDDDPNFRAVMTEVLQAEGCRVAHAGNGAEALAVLDTLVPDLVLLDMTMPIMNGWELAHVLRTEARFSTIPIAILSASADSHALDDLRSNVRVLKKPVDLPNLLGLLDVVDDAQSIKLNG